MGDKLLEEVKKMDLEYMQQADIVESIKDLINKQPIVDKTINIDRINNFDNRKFRR